MVGKEPGELRIGALLCLAIYLSLSAVSAISHDFWRDARRVERRAGVYDAIVAGRGKAPGQYRVMIPYLAEGLREVGVPFRAAVVSLRFLFTAVSAGSPFWAQEALEKDKPTPVVMSFQRWVERQLT